MKILIGYDGSNSSKDAVVICKKHAVAFKAKVIIVKSLEGGRRTTAEEVEKTENYLTVIKKEFEKENIQCETKVLVRGMTPGEDIVEYAKENIVDEIIIGIKRRSKVEKLIFGSNAQYIILNADCPVVTIK